jgi:transcriptional regulator with XRE-family HTH domain
MPDHISTKIGQLWSRFASKVYRDVFVSSELSTNIAAQISTMREDRGWTQADLADRAGMAQGRISVLENPEYEGTSLTTLKRLASAFDVGLAVRFVPFSDNLAWAVPERENHLSVVSFAADSAPAQGTGAAMRVVRFVVYANEDNPEDVVEYSASTPKTAIKDITTSTQERRHA